MPTILTGYSNKHLYVISIVTLCVRHQSKLMFSLSSIAKIGFYVVIIFYQEHLISKYLGMSMLTKSAVIEGNEETNRRERRCHGVINADISSAKQNWMGINTRTFDCSLISTLTLSRSNRTPALEVYTATKTPGFLSITFPSSGQ